MKDKNKKNRKGKFEKLSPEDAKRIAELSKWFQDEATKIAKPFAIYQNMAQKIAESVRTAILPTQVAVIQITKQLQEAYKKIVEPIIVIQKDLGRIFEHWAEWVKSNEHIFQNIQDTLSDFAKKYKIAEKDAIECMQKYKWFVSPSVPLSFIFEVFTLANKRGNHSAAVNGLFVGLIYDNNFEFLNHLLDEWKTEVDSKRYKIIKNTFSLIKLSPPNINIADVVVPTLIVQIDGIMMDYLKKHGLNPTQMRYKDRKNSIKTKGKSSLPIEMTSLANDIFLEILFQKSYPGQPLRNPFQFNRHKILHGENKNYGRKVYLVRAILILDYIINLK